MRCVWEQGVGGAHEEDATVRGGGEALAGRV
jgi:hypothetical protein